MRKDFSKTSKRIISMTPSKSPFVLCILDGWGVAPPSPYNAVSQANLPNWNRFQKTYATTYLDASGESVGLPKGQMGNSEVGHTTIGAGRVIMQDLPRINHAFQNNLVSSLPQMKSFLEKAHCNKNTTCHVLGLLSPGGVHSHQDHLEGFLRILDAHGISTNVHCFLDGRDTPPQSALLYLEQFDAFMKALNHGKIATLMGRFYGMDRDKRWERTEKAFNAIVGGHGIPTKNVKEAIASFYEESIFDEFMPPIVVDDYKGMQKNDSLLMGNFRADRVQQILSALLLKDFSHFERIPIPSFNATLGMKSYSSALDPFIPSLFPQEQPKNTLGEIIQAHNLKQLRAAETEKYAHVTFFFNGGKEDPYPLEDRLLVPSPKVKTYDLMPEMNASLLTEQVIEKMNKTSYDLVVLNFANPDMVGHTGNLNATIKALEVIDRCLGKLEEFLKENNGKMIVTADHGNAEHMKENEAPHTAHTTNLVPLILVDPSKKEYALKPKGELQDIAPTILSLLNLPTPEEMTGCSLIVSS
jgi:2,3-bisphosphoglycerate-independent phosphoglycerate mutase